MTPFPFRLMALAATTLLASCATARGPEPIQEQQLGSVITPASRIVASDDDLFSACGRDAETARVVVASWLDAVSRIEECDLATARYYTAPEREADIAARLEALSMAASPECRAQAGQVMTQVRSANRQVARWVPRAVGLCSLPVQSKAAADMREQHRRQTAELRCQIHEQFPGIRSGICL